MLTSFCISNFRAFESLELPRLRSVNLVVGRNNVGKTMLLEALRVHRAQGVPSALLGLLGTHDEFLRDHPEHRSWPPVDVASLFFGWNTSEAAWLGPKDEPEQRLDLEVVPADAKSSPGHDDDASGHRLSTTYGGRPSGWIRLSSSRGYLQASSRLSGPEYREVVRREGQYAHLGCPFVGPGSVTDDTIARWWDATSLTEAEDRVIDSLRIISPVERISLIAHPMGDKRMIQVLREGESRPLPLRHLGDGMARIFALALALESARESGLLLIDEIENGIHYTGLPRLWHFIFEAAARYDMQVFATTHSWDCVQAFQAAAVAHSGMEGTLIKLFREDARIHAATLSEEDLTIVTRDSIEVR